MATNQAMTPYQRRVEKWASELKALEKAYPQPPKKPVEVTARIDDLTPTMKMLLVQVYHASLKEPEVSRSALCRRYRVAQLNPYQVHILGVLVALKLITEHWRAKPVREYVGKKQKRSGSGAEFRYVLHPLVREHYDRKQQEARAQQAEQQRLEAAAKQAEREAPARLAAQRQAAEEAEASRRATAEKQAAKQAKVEAERTAQARYDAVIKKGGTLEQAMCAQHQGEDFYTGKYMMRWDQDKKKHVKPNVFDRLRGD